MVVVGAGLAGVRTCASLRDSGYAGRLTLLSAEDVSPYDRPPLSKSVLAGGPPVELSPEWYADVDLRLGVRALSLHPSFVRTSDGDLPYDGLVLACGAAPIALPGEGAITLRTYADAVLVRSAFTPGARVVLVGAGWIGAEVATAAAAAGCSVTVLEAGPAPLAAALGAPTGALTIPWYAEHGIELRCDTPVSSVSAASVELADGSVLHADVVVVGVGVRPAVEWLAGSGLDLDRGVLTDASCRTNLPHVLAVGDCAARWSPTAGRHARGEHWDDALHAPTVAATVLLGGSAEYDAVPYVWSEQLGRYVQWVGHRVGSPVYRGDPAEGEWAAAWLTPEGALAGYLAVDRRRDVMPARRLIAAAHRPDPARLADPSVPMKSV